MPRGNGDVPVLPWLLKVQSLVRNTVNTYNCSGVGQTTGLPLEFGHCSRASILKG